MGGAYGVPPSERPGPPQGAPTASRGPPGGGARTGEPGLCASGPTPGAGGVRRSGVTSVEPGSGVEPGRGTWTSSTPLPVPVVSVLEFGTRGYLTRELGVEGRLK